MKNICKVKIHPLFYIFGFLAVITGLFREFLTFTLIIIFHELGHIIGGFLFKIYPKQVNIYPFGGLTIFQMKINIELYKEFVIALSGPIFQIITFLLFKNVFGTNFTKYNLFLLIFNLLPIYPLDGSKLLNCLINKITSFKISFYVVIYISIISTFLFLFLVFYRHLSFTWILILALLFIKILEERKNFKLLFNKFLWERYNYKLTFKKEKLIKKINQMHRDYKHLFKINHYLLNEEEILKKRFDFKDKMW